MVFNVFCAEKDTDKKWKRTSQMLSQKANINLSILAAWTTPYSRDPSDPRIITFRLQVPWEPSTAPTITSTPAATFPFTYKRVPYCSLVLGSLELLILTTWVLLFTRYTPCPSHNYYFHCIQCSFSTVKTLKPTPHFKVQIAIINIDLQYQLHLCVQT